MPVESLAAGESVAGYVVETLVGRGGMGEVYRARDERLERPVALKLLLRSLADDERFRERMLRESRLAASLDHPNVIPIYEAGEADERLFIAMRYVDGCDLKAWLRREGSLDPRAALAVAGQVAAALDAAHANGLVHRDVKPSNVLIDDPDGRAHCYLADFGLTQTANRDDRADGQDLGTIDYVSPEQIRGDPLDGRADQYALGCLLFESLTGAVPYRRASDVAALFAHLDEEVPRATERRPELPPTIDGVLARALAKEPADRYESCEALVLEARAALGLDDPVRHHRRTAWAVAVGVVALAAAIASAILGLRGADSPPSARAGALVAIDLASGKVTRDYATPPVPTHVTTQSGRVWFAAQDGIWRVDPRISGDPVRVENVGEVHDLAGYKGRVYVARDGQKLFEGIVAPYDAVTGVRADGLSLLACSLTANDRIGVWAAGCPNVQQVSITTSSIAIGKRVMIPYTQPTTSGTERQCLCAMTIGGGSVWVAGDASDRRLWQIDPAGRITRTISLPVAPRGIAIAAGSVWVSAPMDDVVIQIDIASGHVMRRIPVGRNPMGIAAGGGAVWVANSLDGSVSRIDPAVARVTKTIEVGGHPYEPAVGMGSLWVTTRDD